MMFFNTRLEVWFVERCKCMCNPLHHKQGIKHNSTIVHYDKLSESVTSNGSLTKHKRYDVESGNYCERTLIRGYQFSWIRDEMQVLVFSNSWL